MLRFLKSMTRCREHALCEPSKYLNKQRVRTYQKIGVPV